MCIRDSSIRVGPHFFELLRQEEASIDASAITLDFSISNRTYASRITDDQLCQLIVSYGFTRLCHLAGCLWLVCVFFFFNFSYVTVRSLLHFLHQQPFAFSSVYVFFPLPFFFHRNSSTLLSGTRIRIRNATRTRYLSKIANTEAKERTWILVNRRPVPFKVCIL